MKWLLILIHGHDGRVVKDECHSHTDGTNNQYVTLGILGNPLPFNFLLASWEDMMRMVDIVWSFDNSMMISINNIDKW